MLIDTHCHIHDPNYDWTPDDVIKRSIELGIEKFITIGTSIEDSFKAAEFVKNRENVWWTLGYHPEEYDGDKGRLESELARAKELLKDGKLAGIGEVGLDYHSEGYNKQIQIYLLENMLQIAQDNKLPVSFHVRDAFEDFWAVFDNFHLVPSVLHSYSDNEKNMHEGLKRGLYFGTNGLSTFAKIPHPSIDCIICETDAPYLTPKPFRGKINIPGYIKYIAEWLAEYYQMDFGEVEKITTKNAETIFKI